MPVSYTHLDVYKRQIHYCTSTSDLSTSSSSMCLTTYVGISHLEGGFTLRSVSYTHLILDDGVSSISKSVSFSSRCNSKRFFAFMLSLIHILFLHFSSQCLNGGISQKLFSSSLLVMVCKNSSSTSSIFEDVYKRQP